MSNQNTITEKDRAMAKKCLECGVCNHARKKQRGLIFWFVKKVEGGVCPFCRAYEKVYGRKAHEPLTEPGNADDNGDSDDDPEPPADQVKRLKRKKRVMSIIAAVVGGYVLLSYLLLPMLWSHYEHHPVMEKAVKRTRTKDGIPGDPLNVGLIGTRAELIRAMSLAGWRPADPITLRSSASIVESVLLHKPDPDAPVSNLYLFGRKQDLAFEQPVGGSARQRHHVRFWFAPQLGQDGRPMWLGADTFDRSVGLSHRTGQITHHIGPDIDAERDRLFADLERAGQLTRIYQVSGIGPTLTGRNGGGDWFYTDGELTIGLLSTDNIRQTTPPTPEANPTAVNVKNRVWSFVKKQIQ